MGELNMARPTFTCQCKSSAASICTSIANQLHLIRLSSHAHNLSPAGGHSQLPVPNGGDMIKESRRIRSRVEEWPLLGNTRGAAANGQMTVTEQMPIRIPDQMPMSASAETSGTTQRHDSAAVRTRGR